MAKSFTAQVDDWVRKTKKRGDVVSKTATQSLILAASETVTGITRGGSYVRGKIPVDLGTLAGSLVSGLNGGIIAQGETSYTAVIAGMEGGDVAFFGWGGPAKDYVLHVHYGTSKMPGRFWVTDAIVNWQGYVNDAVAKAKARVA